MPDPTEPVIDDRTKDILGKCTLYFTVLHPEERRALLDVLNDPAEWVSRHVESIAVGIDGVAVKFLIVRGDNRLGCWAVRDIVSGLTQAVADLLNERRIRI